MHIASDMLMIFTKYTLKVHATWLYGFHGVSHHASLPLCDVSRDARALSLVDLSLVDLALTVTPGSFDMNSLLDLSLQCSGVLLAQWRGGCDLDVMEHSR